jgi:hypothetical protein
MTPPLVPPSMIHAELLEPATLRAAPITPPSKKFSSLHQSIK